MTDAESADVAQTVERLLRANAEARRGLTEAIAGLSEEQRRERWSDGWSLHELVAHIAAWEDGFATALVASVRGERPVVPGYDSSRDDATDDFNARMTAEAALTPWPDLLARLAAAQAHHDAALRGVVTGGMTAERFAEGRTARRLANAADHYEEHVPAIRTWRTAGMREGASGA